MKHDVLVFKQYPFTVGDKIHIEDGRRKGDWEVAGIEEHKVVLRCPISKKEFSWNGARVIGKWPGLKNTK